VPGVQVPVLAYIKTSLTAGFSSFQPSLVFCPVGVNLLINRGYWGKFGVAIGVSDRDYSGVLRSNIIDLGEISIFAPMNSIGTPQNKKSKGLAGTPQVKNSHGRLQIVFTYDSVRKYIAARKPEGRQNRQKCELVARIMEDDCRSGCLDATWRKYEEMLWGKNSSSKQLPVSNKEISLRDLWDKYTSYKRHLLAPSTIAKDFRRVASHIEKFPVSKVLDAVAIRDYLIATTTPGTAGRILTQLSAVHKWAVKSGIKTSNPFRGMAADLKSPKRTSDDEIDPFTVEEKDRIIQAFKDADDPHAELVEFLFKTGCRPSEAIGLQWKHIASEYKTITFEQAVTVGEDGLVLKKRLKTQEKRVFPCSDTLKSFLKSIEPEQKDRERFIFTPLRGKYVDFHNFSNRHWHPILRTLEGIRKRNPYQTRHTFITFCIDFGMDAKDVAKLVGNSAQTIYKHYAGSKRDLIAPDI
jgi:integrase